MKSVIFESCGEPTDVLQVRDVPEREPGPGEVKVRMLASPVNPSDLMFIRGRYTLSPELPATPGLEGVGVVEQSGAGLRPKLMAGKRVCVLSRAGGNWAETNVVPATQVIPFSPLLTGNLTLEQAATFFVNPATAFVMTNNVLRVARGAWLLQTAAASTLGRMIIRLGQRTGFRTLCVVRREDQAEELRQLGADKVIRFDPQEDAADAFSGQIREATDGDGIRYAIDCVGGQTGSAVIQCLGSDGHMLVFGTLSGDPLMFGGRDLMTPGAKIEGFWLGNYMARLKLIAKLSLVRQIAGLIREGVLSSEIGSSYSLDQVSEAVSAAEQTGRSGKILIRPTSE